MVATATMAPTTVMRAAAPSPVVTDARGCISPAELVDRAFATCTVWATAARSITATDNSQTEMLARHDHGQDRDNNLPGTQQPPAPHHRLPLGGIDVVSWCVVPVHAMRAVWARVGVWACSSMRATRCSKTGIALASI